MREQPPLRALTRLHPPPLPHAPGAASVALKSLGRRVAGPDLSTWAGLWSALGSAPGARLLPLLTSVLTDLQAAGGTAAAATAAAGGGGAAAAGPFRKAATLPSVRTTSAALRNSDDDVCGAAQQDSPKAAQAASAGAPLSSTAAADGASAQASSSGRLRPTAGLAGGSGGIPVAAMRAVVRAGGPALTPLDTRFDPAWGDEEPPPFTPTTQAAVARAQQQQLSRHDPGSCSGDSGAAAAASIVPSDWEQFQPPVQPAQLSSCDHEPCQSGGASGPCSPAAGGSMRSDAFSPDGSGGSSDDGSYEEEWHPDFSEAAVDVSVTVCAGKLQQAASPAPQQYDGNPAHCFTEQRAALLAA